MRYAPCRPTPMRLRAQAAAENTAAASLQLAQQQFELGAVNYLILLNAQTTYQNARINRLRAQAARYSDTAALFQALGGGWWHRSDVDPQVAGQAGSIQPPARAGHRAAAGWSLRSGSPEFFAARVAEPQRSKSDDQANAHHADSGRHPAGRVFGFEFFVDGKVAAFMATMGSMPQTVSTTKATSTDWQTQLEAVGSLRASTARSCRCSLPVPSRRSTSSPAMWSRRARSCCACAATTMLPS